MNSAVSKNKLFIAACISLIVTAMTFAIRAGILGQLGEDFEINNTQLGFCKRNGVLGISCGYYLWRVFV